MPIAKKRQVFDAMAPPTEQQRLMRAKARIALEHNFYSDLVLQGVEIAKRKKQRRFITIVIVVDGDGEPEQVSITHKSTFTPVPRGNV